MELERSTRAVRFNTCGIGVVGSRRLRIEGRSRRGLEASGSSLEAVEGRGGQGDTGMSATSTARPYPPLITHDSYPGQECLPAVPTGARARDEVFFMTVTSAPQRVRFPS
jgi:hypothetical protein